MRCAGVVLYDTAVYVFFLPESLVSLLDGAELQPMSFFGCAFFFFVWRVGGGGGAYLEMRALFFSLVLSHAPR